MRRYLTDKADVFSFGVVPLEIVSGKSNANCHVKDDFIYLLDWANILQEKGALLELVDPALGTNFSIEEAQQMLNLGLLCTNPTAALRPSMSTVVTLLEDHTPIHVPTMKITRTGSTELIFTPSDHNKAVSMDGPWADSTLSMQSSNRGDDHFHSTTTRLLSDYMDSR